MNRVMICLLILAPSNTQNNPLTTALAASIQFIFGTRLIVEDTESFTSFVITKTSSAIWLARDRDHDVYFAIKILTAKASKHRNELGCLHYLSKKPSTHPGRKYVLASFLDRHFWLKGPNGRHLALVSRVSGPSASQMTGWHIRIRERLARKMARQITQGLAYLHPEGICHRNLTGSSVLVQLTNCDSWSVEKVYEQLGQSAIVDLCGGVWSREPSTTEYLGGSAEFFRAGPRLLTEDISIIGYTNSFHIKITEAFNTDEEKLPNGFAAPENLFGFKGRFPSDLWALGCIIYQIRAGQLLFSRSVDVSPAEATKEIVDTIEHLPNVFAGIKFVKMAFRTNVGTNSRWIIRRGFYSVNGLLISKPNAKLWMLSVLLVLTPDSTS